jgi:asparagine N-glycosylation enzyme membrane subunit Stt3
MLPSLVVQLIESLSFMAQGNPWTKDILEYMPIAKDNDMLAPVGLLSWFFWLIPPAILGSAYLTFKKSSYQNQAAFFLMSAIVFMLSTLSHQRFGTLLQINIVILAGLSVQLIHSHIKRTGLKAIAWVVILLMLMPALKNTYLYTQHDFNIFRRQKIIMRAMEWIRDNTPPTSHFMEPWLKPEYGVLASWDEGSWIENIARRPAVATLFGSEVHGLKESARFTLASTESEAFEILRENNVRYVVIRNMVASLAKYAGILGTDHKGYAELKQSEKGSTYWQPGPKYFSLISTRLLYNDGIQNEKNKLRLPKVGHMRLLYESPESFRVIGMKQGPSRVKVFEYVKCASLDVHTEPGNVVSISLPLITTRGRSTEYVDRAKAGPDGTASFNLPYSTGRWPDRVSAIGSYTISGNSGKKVSLSVTEQMVLEGGKLETSLP